MLRMMVVMTVVSNDRDAFIGYNADKVVNAGVDGLNGGDVSMWLLMGISELLYRFVSPFFSALSFAYAHDVLFT